ncbi:hypothetical protein Dimus_011444 [Dionaea muscipula]
MDKVAGAPADVLDASKKSFDKYFDQAESYLYQYHTSHSSTAVAAAQGSHLHHQGTAPPSAHHLHGGQAGDDQEDSSAGGRYGHYIKMAQEFLKKY